MKKKFTQFLTGLLTVTMLASDISLPAFAAGTSTKDKETSETTIAAETAECNEEAVYEASDNEVITVEEEYDGSEVSFTSIGRNPFANISKTNVIMATATSSSPEISTVKFGKGSGTAYPRCSGHARTDSPELPQLSLDWGGPEELEVFIRFKDVTKTTDRTMGLFEWYRGESFNLIKSQLYQWDMYLYCDDTTKNKLRGTELYTYINDQTTIGTITIKPQKNSSGLLEYAVSYEMSRGTRLASIIPVQQIQVNDEYIDSTAKAYIIKYNFGSSSSTAYQSLSQLGDNLAASYRYVYIKDKTEKKSLSEDPQEAALAQLEYTLEGQNANSINTSTDIHCSVPYYYIPAFTMYSQPIGQEFYRTVYHDTDAQGKESTTTKRNITISGRSEYEPVIPTPLNTDKTFAGWSDTKGGITNVYASNTALATDLKTKATYRNLYTTYLPYDKFVPTINIKSSISLNDLKTKKQWVDAGISPDAGLMEVGEDEVSVQFNATGAGTTGYFITPRPNNGCYYFSNAYGTWHTDVQLNGTAMTGDTLIDGYRFTNYKQTFEIPPESKITFNAGEGTFSGADKIDVDTINWKIPASTISGKNGQYITAVGFPQKDADVHEPNGYTFVGWFTAPDGGTRVTDGSGKLTAAYDIDAGGSPYVFEDTITFYAHYKSKAEAAAIEFAGKAADAKTVYEKAISDNSLSDNEITIIEEKLQIAEKAYKDLSADAKTLVANGNAIIDGTTFKLNTLYDLRNGFEGWKVKSLIYAIGDPDKITKDSNSAIKNARAAYSKLGSTTHLQDAAEAKAAQLEFVKDDLATLEKIEYYYENKIPADTVVALIDKIGKIEPATIKDETELAEAGSRISNAKIAYEALTNAQKGINKYTSKPFVTNYDKIAESENAYAAMKVILEYRDAANELDENKKKEKEEAANGDYNNLSDEVKNIVDKMRAAEVDDLIKAVGDPSSVDEKSKEAIEKARRAYDALTDGQKELVKSLDNLIKAEENFQIIYIGYLIKTLPDNITIADGKLIQEIRTLYEKLSDDKKKLVNIKPLIAAEEKYFVELEKNAPDGIWVYGVTDKTYCGKAVTQNVTVYDHTKKLTEGQDYTVSYRNNINVGSGKKTPTMIVKMTGSYKGSSKVPFNITAADISGASVANTVYAMKGKGAKVKPALYMNGKKLREKKDYTIAISGISGKKATKTGTYKVQVTGKGNYTGTLEFDITILDSAKSIKGAEVSYTKEFTYKGVAVAPVPSVTIEASENNVSGNDAKKTVRIQLIRGKDYTVSYENNNKAGKAKMIISGIGDYTGTVTKTFVIKDKDFGRNVVITGISNQMYKGEPVTFDIKAAADGEVLTEGKDYILQYKGNNKAGKATVTLIGKGEYTDAKHVEKFKIAKSNLALAEASINKLQHTTGSKPAVTVTMDGKILSAGKDYKVTYKNNKKIGAASIIITGKGNYTGKKVVNYAISAEASANEIQKCTVKYNDISSDKPYKNGYMYSAKEIKPKMVLSYGKGKNAVKLVEGKDYEVVGYKNNVNIGTGYVIVQGKGTYTGIAEIPFRINTCTTKTRWKGVFDIIVPD